MSAPTEPSSYSQTPSEVLRFEAGELAYRDDLLASEEALEIRVPGAEPVITMRTPGNDPELAAGLLLSEGAIASRDDIVFIDHSPGRAHTLHARIRTDARATGAALARSSLSNSACGVCGKAKLDLEPLRSRPPIPGGPSVAADTLLQLPQRLRAAQRVFKYTGGLHASALFDAHGRLRLVREDVGRHNAMDKLIGWAVLNERLPLHEHVVLLSGRASYELSQKAIMASVPIVCAVSAPSSFAVRLAREFGVTLVGFLRDNRFNIYSAPQRIVGCAREASSTPVEDCSSVDAH